MGHIGLTPQSLHQMGGFKVQGRDGGAGASSCSTTRARSRRPAATRSCSRASRASSAREITDAISIPTIGIGAGVHCDGQVLVIYDMLGMNEEFRPKFVQALRQPRRPHSHRRRAVHHRSAQRAVSRRGAQLLQGGAAAAADVGAGSRQSRHAPSRGGWPRATTIPISDGAVHSAAVPEER